MRDFTQATDITPERCSSARGNSTPPTTPPLNGRPPSPAPGAQHRPAAACGETNGPRCRTWLRRLRRLRCRRRSPPLCGTLPPPASPRRCGRAPNPPQSPSRRRRGSRRVPTRLRRLPRSTSLRLRLSLTRDAVRTAGRRTPNITSGAMLHVDSAGVDRVSGGTIPQQSKHGRRESVSPRSDTSRQAHLAVGELTSRSATAQGPKQRVSVGRHAQSALLRVLDSHAVSGEERPPLRAASQVPELRIRRSTQIVRCLPVLSCWVVAAGGAYGDEARQAASLRRRHRALGRGGRQETTAARLNV